MMFEENASGITGLYNVSNTCYMNSVLQALSHVREFRECMLSDEAATSLYATDRSHESPRTKATVLAGEILSFPGFRKKRKRRKAESGVDKTSIVPLSEFSRSWPSSLSTIRVRCATVQAKKILEPCVLLFIYDDELCHFHSEATCNDKERHGEYSGCGARKSCR